VSRPRLESVACRIQNKHNLARFSVSTVVLMKIQFFSDVTLRRLIVADVSEDITTSIFRAKQSKKNGKSLKIEALFLTKLP
jgi:hypothetical protein